MAITYGMSVKEFWEESPDLFWAYRFSYYEKQKQDAKEVNYKAWLHGAYVYEGISLALNNAFSKNKLKYPTTPYGENKIEQSDAQEQIVANIKARTQQIKNMFQSKNTSLIKGERR